MLAAANAYKNFLNNNNSNKTTTNKNRNISAFMLNMTETSVNGLLFGVQPETATAIATATATQPK